MERPFAAVMLDLARIQEEVGTEFTLLHENEWAPLINELADLSEAEYQAALAVHRTITKIAASASTASRPSER